MPISSVATFIAALIAIPLILLMLGAVLYSAFIWIPIALPLFILGYETAAQWVIYIAAGYVSIVALVCEIKDDLDS